MSRKCKTLEIGLFSLKRVEFTMVYRRIRNYKTLHKFPLVLHISQVLVDTWIHTFEKWATYPLSKMPYFGDNFDLNLLDFK